MIRQYSKYISVWISEKDRGQTHALNKGYVLATGSIIGWQNSDDLYEKGAFSQAVRCFNANPEVDFVYGNYRLINKESIIQKNYFVIDFDIRTKIYENTIIYNQALFWKKSFSDKMIYPELDGPFDESINFVMDADFIYRAYIEGANFFRINKFLGSFRMHPDNKTTHLNDIFVVEYDAIRYKYFNEFSKRKEFFCKYYFKIRRHLLSLASRSKFYL